MTARLVMLAAALALSLGTAAANEPLAFLGGTVVDGSGAPPIPDSVLVTDGERITAMGPRSDVPIPEGAEIIDVTGKWLVPELIDAHVHFFQSGGLYARPDIIDLRDTVPYEQDVARQARS